MVQNHQAMMRALVAARERHELSQEAVAERMGVSQSAVSQFERADSNPTLATLRRYAVAVGVRVYDVVVDDYWEPQLKADSAPPGARFISRKASTNQTPKDSWGSAPVRGVLV